MPASRNACAEAGHVPPLTAMVMPLAATPTAISHMPGSLRFIQSTTPSIAYDARWPPTATACGMDGHTVMTATCRTSAASTIDTPRNLSVVRRPSDPPHSGVINTSASAQRPRNTSHHLEPGGRNGLPEGLFGQRGGDAVSGDGARQVEALDGVGAHGRQHPQRYLVFDALGGDHQPELMPEVDRRADDDLVLRILAQCSHESPVDLQLVHRQLLEVGERLVAGAEVGDGDLAPEAPQARHSADASGGGVCEDVPCDIDGKLRHV